MFVFEWEIRLRHNPLGRSGGLPDISGSEPDTARYVINSARCFFFRSANGYVPEQYLKVFRFLHLLSAWKNKNCRKAVKFSIRLLFRLLYLALASGDTLCPQTSDRFFRSGGDFSKNLSPMDWSRSLCQRRVIDRASQWMGQIKSRCEKSLWDAPMDSVMTLSSQNSVQCAFLW